MTLHGQLNLLADARPELLLDLDVDQADAMVLAVYHAAHRPPPCRCVPSPLPWDDRALGARCLRCGRRLA